MCTFPVTRNKFKGKKSLEVEELKTAYHTVGINTPKYKPTKCDLEMQCPKVG
jgi:hypothetical protein